MTHERPLPQPTVHTAAFWSAAKQHVLVVQQCRSCSHVQFYPRPFCLKCLSEEPRWLQCSGTGRIYTFTVNHRTANSFMESRVPYAVAVVTLDEGVKMFANIVDLDLALIRIGAPVQVVFEDINDDLSLPQFKLLNP